MAAVKAATAVADTTISKAAVPTVVVRVATSKAVSRVATAGRHRLAVCDPVHWDEYRKVETRG